MGEDLDRIIAMSRWFDEATATRTIAWEFGTVIRHDGFPTRWDSNFLRAERPIAGASAADLSAVADELLAPLAHRELVFENGADGERLAPGFAELGYEVDRLLVMVLRRERDHAPRLAAREVTFEQMRPVSVLANEESHGGMTHDVAETLADFDRVARDRAGARFFLADVDGRAAAMAEVYVHDGAAEIDGVHTLSAFRNRGGARAAVGIAIDAARAAGADLIWLLADAADWPRELYTKLGFDPIGEWWQFTKPPAGESYR
jgi:ribosomal protein S18 acetylase RimI-like enzyme